MTDDEPQPSEPAKKTRRRRARGSIYKRDDGRWCAALSLKGGGRKYIYGDTQAEVERRLTAAKSTVDQGGPLVDDRLSVATVVDAFLDEREHRVRPRTMESYRQLAEQHIKPQLGKFRAATLTSEDVQGFANRRVREGASASLIHHVLVVLRMAFKLAVARRRVTFNPTEGVHGPKVERAVGAPLDAADTQKLLDAARTHPLGAVWFLAASLGLRQGEIFGLRWRDVDLIDGRLSVKHQLHIKRAKPGEVGAFASRAELAPPKTKRGVRTLAIDPAVVALLRARKKRQAADRLAAGDIWQDQLGLIFTCPLGEPLDRGTMSKVHRQLLQSAGVRHVRFHDLRHGAATLMLAAGVDPATLSATLGHSRVAFTLDTYVHATDERVDDAVGRLAGVLSLGGKPKTRP